MCTLIALYRIVPGYDLVIGMNRDEDRMRPSVPPQLLDGTPAIVAPRDSRAGGTWLGVNESGLVAALSNRRGKMSTAAKSRGLLMLEILKQPNPRASAIVIDREVGGNDYNFFNIFAATRDELRFFSFDGQVRSARGHEGLNILTNAGGNVEDDPKGATIRLMAAGAKFSDVVAATHWLQNTLRHHGGTESAALCVHGTGGGTVSSTVLALHNASREDHVLFYADGSPCQTPYRDYSRLLQSFPSQA
ncbi:MAG TPA: NRDE family protein [Thermoplasmata archaeon]|nr:NRDE family protein [Thermoplasmata archaeon]HLA47213.1 NRDE family protein [Thermoplasmata archaeon]